jgi:hypothetical protein
VDRRYFRESRVSPPKIPDVENPPVPEGPAAPGQTQAHSGDTADDPMKEREIAFAGDQLKELDLRQQKIYSLDPTPHQIGLSTAPRLSQLCGIPCRASLLQYSYSFLHKAQSVNQVGTIKFFRVRYNRRNSTPAKVLDSLQGSEELFISVGRAYIVTAALDVFGMSSTDDAPTINKLPANISRDTEENKKKYFDDAFGRFISKYLLQKDNNSVADDEDDYIRNYALCCIFLTILILQMKDTSAEGDGERNLINQKLLLSVFKSLGSYSMYALEMFTSIAQIEYLLTPRRSEVFKWGFFVNWCGGEGKNIEDDLAQEISNRVRKGIVQRQGANKTIQSISKVCRATSGIQRITEQFDISAGIHKVSGQHTTLDSIKDEKEMIEDLTRLDPFNHEPGRCHDSFPSIKSCPLKYLNVVEFHQWLKAHSHSLSERSQSPYNHSMTVFPLGLELSYFTVSRLVSELLEYRS